MSELKAFVGHSFAVDDEDTIRPILEYLNQIQEMNLGFSWENAKPAEPRELAEKVLSLIEDKNLFIGICTKKEIVTDYGNLEKKLFSRGYVCAREENISWKTSDWIIQEIGLAIGRKMEVILLIEHGVQKPGGLQGDLEYIEFSRESPEKSFVKILEMIQALLPKARKIDSGTAENPKTAQETSSAEKEENWLAPSPDWTRKNYEAALFHTVIAGDNEKEAAVHNSYIESEEGQEQELSESWNALKEYYHLIFTENGSLANLEELANRNPRNCEVLKYLARGYQHYSEEEKAAEYYLAAANCAAEKDMKIMRLGDAARASARAKKHNKLSMAVSQIKEEASSIESSEHAVLKIIRDIAEIQDDSTGYLAAAERMLDLKPDDHDSRFSLAYAHSQNSNEELSYFHYLKIPFQNRSPMAWNNLGVANQRLNMNGAAVDAYRIAEKEGETLAMDNIARMFLSAGFFKEAQSRCDEAKTKETYSKNIDETSFRLKNVRDDEENRSNELLENIAPEHDFYVSYGRALAQQDIPSMSGRWRSTECSLSLEIKDGIFKATGIYEQTSLAGLLAGNTGGTVTKDKYEIVYEGRVIGKSIKGKFRRNEFGKSPKETALLSQDNNSNEVLMVMSDEETEIKVFHKNASTQHEKFRYLRKDSDPLPIT